MNWGRLAVQSGVAALLVLGFLYGAKVTAGLVDAERKLTANAMREPQIADPLQTYVEVTLPEAPMPLLSAGYLGIAPSIHLIRFNTALPLANVDQIENLARRRYGRVDLNFVLVNFVPLLLLPIALLAVQEMREKNAWHAVRGGRKKLLDFAMEHIMLPLFAWAGLGAAALLAVLYAFGLKLDSNENLLRLALWLLAVGIYSLFWLLVFAACLAHAKTLNRAAALYAFWGLVLLVAAPGLSASLQAAVSRPEPRTEIALLRLERLQTGGGAIPESGSSHGQSKILKLAPGLFLQDLADILAGTDAGRYGDFRQRVVAFSRDWRSYLLPFVQRKEALDYDDLRRAPKFAFAKENDPRVVTRVIPNLFVLLLFLLCPAWSIRKAIQNQPD
jgi:hypothetical protein